MPLRRLVWIRWREATRRAQPVHCERDVCEGQGRCSGGEFAVVTLVGDELRLQTKCLMKEGNGRPNIGHIEDCVSQGCCHSSSLRLECDRGSQLIRGSAVPASFGPGSLEVLDQFAATLSNHWRWSVEMRHPAFFEPGPAR